MEVEKKEEKIKRELKRRSLKNRDWLEHESIRCFVDALFIRSRPQVQSREKRATHCLQRTKQRRAWRERNTILDDKQWSLGDCTASRDVHPD